MAENCAGEGFSEELMCALCLDSWRDPVEMVPCGHIFCRECAKIVKNCPVCRGEIQGQRTPNRTLVNLALSVRCRCRMCGWTGTREESQNHKCPPLGQSGSTSLQSSMTQGRPSAGGGGRVSLDEIFGGAPQCGASAPAPVSSQLSSSGAPFGMPNYPSSNTYAQWQQQPPTPQPSNGYFSTNNGGGYPGGVQAPSNSGYPYQQQQPGMPPAGPPRRRYQTIEPSGSRPWMLYGIGQQEYDQIVSLFIFFDADDSGQLDRNEVSRLARWLNFARTPQEVDRIFADMDSNGSGALSLGEFLTWLKYNKPNPEALYGLSQSQYNTIMMQFHTYDQNQDGLLEEPEFCRLVLGLGDVRDVSEAQRLFRRIDANGDRSIDLHEFLRFRAGRR